ncbi:MAG: hypothetical protein U0807_17780 [Candidatus Binatia bacterium]
MTRLSAVACMIVAFSTAAHAVDRPIAGHQLLLKRSRSGKEKLLFVSKDPGFLFPAIGSPTDDPITGSPGGAQLDLIAVSGTARAFLSLPNVAGKPGWTAKPGTVDQYKFVNPLAPAGISPIKTAVLKEGKLLKIVAAVTGLDLASPLGGVAVRFVTGTLRSCAFFEPETVVKDEPGLFVARYSAASALADCDLDLGAATLARPDDPVVFTGAVVPTLVGVPPSDVVAFRRIGLSWEQVPVQVDERDLVLFDDVYGPAGGFGGGFESLDYSDAGTFTGPDTNPTLDGDDEIVLMAADTGGRAVGTSAPSGVVAGSGVEITVTSPSNGDRGWVYLFQRASGGLDPSAGRQYVDYQFDLLSGPYLTTYSVASGPNPEDSTVTTDTYARHFSDRWVSDGLRIAAGTGADILDRHKNLFDPSNCGRSEDTFSSGEGAFVVNTSGPVRAIRSYVGANSGPLTQRQHYFYRRREDLTTRLRVHPIPAMMDVFDYSPAAAGMTYRNPLNLLGLAIDGAPESASLGSLAWEMVTGVQGSLVIAHLIATDIPGFAATSYWLDDSTPPVPMCTGDAFAYGASGPRITTAIPNTDPTVTPFRSLAVTRVMYYGAPGLSAVDAGVREVWARYPLVATGQPWP